MTTEELDPLIHVPTRLKIVATLAALPDGDTLTVTRLQELSARLDATLTATTHGELSQAAQDLPDLTMFSARVKRKTFPRWSGWCLRSVRGDRSPCLARGSAGGRPGAG